MFKTMYILYFGDRPQDQITVSWKRKKLNAVKLTQRYSDRKRMFRSGNCESDGGLAT